MINLYVNIVRYVTHKAPKTPPNALQNTLVVNARGVFIDMGVKVIGTPSLVQTNKKNEEQPRNN